MGLATAYALKVGCDMLLAAVRLGISVTMESVI
jgi:hypothetical protein